MSADKQLQDRVDNAEKSLVATEFMPGEVNKLAQSETTSSRLSAHQRRRGRQDRIKSGTLPTSKNLARQSKTFRGGQRPS